MDKFDRRMMTLAYEHGTQSPIVSRKVGVVITNHSKEVVVSACNELSNDIRLPTDMSLNDDDAKAFWVEHAERSAIYKAARAGVSLVGCSLYSTLFPCASCMRAIIQSGVAELVAPTPDFLLQKWSTEFHHSKRIQENSLLKFRPYVAVEIPPSKASG